MTIFTLVGALEHVFKKRLPYIQKISEVHHPNVSSKIFQRMPRQAKPILGEVVAMAGLKDRPLGWDQG